MSGLAMYHSYFDFHDAARDIIYPLILFSPSFQKRLDRVLGDLNFYIPSEMGRAGSFDLIGCSCKKAPDNSSFIKVRDELLAYGDLEKDWDGYGGLPPSKELIEASVLLLNRIFEATNSAPTPMLSNSGEIGFYWKASELGQVSYVELSVNLDGLAYSYLIKRDGVFSGEEDVSVNNAIPRELVDNVLLVAGGVRASKKESLKEYVLLGYELLDAESSISDGHYLKSRKNEQLATVIASDHLTLMRGSGSERSRIFNI